MDRRRFFVCTALVLSLSALAHPGAASTSRKPASRTQPVSKATSKASTTPRPRNSDGGRVATTKPCTPCVVQAAKKGKSPATRKSARAAKDLPCHPKDYVDPKIARNYQAAMRDLRRSGIKPRVTSVWRSSESQAQLHRCSLSTRCRRSNPGLYRALPAGKSIHEAGFAVDMAGIAAGPRGNKQLTPQGRKTVAIMKKHGFSWRYGLADPVHFEADPRKHGYRSVQAAITRTQTTCQVKLAKTRIQKKAGNKIARNQIPGKPRLSTVSTKTRRSVARIRA